MRLLAPASLQVPPRQPESASRPEPRSVQQPVQEQVQVLRQVQEHVQAQEQAPKQAPVRGKQQERRAPLPCPQLRP